MTLHVGDRIGHYDVTALLGEGGMGRVYLANDTRLRRDVALKVLPDAFSHDADRLARFEREAQMLASLNHPNIAQIHGIEEQDGEVALVLELVEGPTLEERIAEGPIDEHEALAIAIQIAEALEAAHDAGVVHRDLKPANIKLRPRGKATTRTGGTGLASTVKVLDFGLAKALDTAPEGDDLTAAPTLAATGTGIGVVVGTAPYMSPEQARGKRLDARTDVWAFGCVLYEMLTGHRAYPGDTLADTVAKIIEREPSFEDLPGGPRPGVRRLLERCLEKDKDQRLADIAEAKAELERELLTPPNESAGGDGAGAPRAAVEAKRSPAPPASRKPKPGSRRFFAEAYGLGGMITIVAGIALGIFLYFTDTSGIYLIGLVPVFVGLMLVLYGFVIGPRLAKLDDS